MVTGYRPRALESRFKTIDGFKAYQRSGAKGSECRV